MVPKEQIKILNAESNVEAFAKKLETLKQGPLKARKIEIFQINVGKRCNLSCKHCHVEASPNRKESMKKETFEKCLEILRKYPDISTIDITGGSPEMNINLEWFINKAAKLKRRLIVRSNIVILLEREYKKFIDLYKANNVEIVASLPDYIDTKSDRQRGLGIFDKVIKVIKTLNKIGYGKKGSDLILNLVHNPVGAYLPGSQSALEHEYHTQLKEKYQIEFNNLFCITNIPIGRYLEYLIKSKNFDEYMCELVTSFNPSAVDNVMCKSTISVGWDGYLYDCDFNQMLDLSVNTKKCKNIYEFNKAALENREIIIGNHCYGCVAGCGSSCQGETV